MIPVGSFAQITEGRWLRPPQDQQKLLLGLSFDTRSYQQEEIFLSLVGSSYNAHQHLSVLDKQPVQCIIVSEDVPLTHPYAAYLKVENSLLAMHLLAHQWAKAFSGKVLAITGSNGKTSTKNWLAEILGDFIRLKVSPKSYNNHLGCPATLFQLDKQDELVVLEMGTNHPGEISALTKIVCPHFSVVLNVGYGHIGNFGSLEQVMLAKSEIFTHMRDPAIAFFPMDCSHIPTHQAKQTKIFDRFARITRITPRPQDPIFAQRLCWHHQEQKHEVLVPLIHDAFAQAMAAILTIAHEFHIPVASLLSKFTKLRPVGGRLFVQPGLKGHWIVDDCYNANPSSVVHLARSIAPLKLAWKMVVLGDLAELQGKEQESAAYIAEKLSKPLIDNLWVFGNFCSHLQAAWAKHKPPVALRLFDTKQKLNEALQHWLATQDQIGVVAFKGSRVSQLEHLMTNFLPPNL